MGQVLAWRRGEHHACRGRGDPSLWLAGPAAEGARATVSPVPSPGGTLLDEPGDDHPSDRVAELQRALDEKDVLLSELRHRVTNTLQAAVSLLAVEAARYPDPAVREPLEEVRDQLRAMAELHRLLGRTATGHRQGGAGGVGNGLAACLREMCAGIARGPGAEGIALRLELAELDCPAERTMPLALIANELVTNAFRHAFPDGRGRIVVRLSADGPGRALLSVSDDGVGAPLATDRGSDSRGDTLGLRLVDALAARVGGTVVTLRGAGTCVSVSWPL